MDEIFREKQIQEVNKMIEELEATVTRFTEKHDNPKYIENQAKDIIEMEIQTLLKCIKKLKSMNKDC